MTVNNTVVLFIANLSNIVGTGWLLWMLPKMNRRDLAFGVTITPDSTSAALVTEASLLYRRIILKHTAVWLIAAVLAGALGLVSRQHADLVTIGFLIAAPLGLLAAAITAYQRVRRTIVSVSVKGTGVREASLISNRSQWQLSAILTALGPFLIILATAGILALNWHAIPVRYPTHWDTHGKADGWALRTPLHVGSPLLAALLINGFILGLHSIIARQVRRVHAGGEAAIWENRGRLTIRSIMIACCYFITIPICAMTVYLPLKHNNESLPGGLLIATVVGNLVLLGYLGVMMGRVGTAMENARKAAAVAGSLIVIGDRTADRNWIWGGSFYYNPDDPAVWVDKRFGIGWTTNMARWQGWAWLLSLTVIPMLLVVLGFTFR